MSFMDKLNESLNSIAPCYHEFLHRYDPKKKQVFAFYEGDEDSSFYCHIIKGIIGEEWELEEIVVGCKNNVVKLQREFDWQHYDKKQIVFFIDRDLSFWLGEPTQYDNNIFVTDGYSVENYVVNLHGFKAWIVHFEGFARAKKHEIAHMVEEFEYCIEKFQLEMMKIMAKAVVAKRHNPSIKLEEFKITRGTSLHFYIFDGHISFEILNYNNIEDKWGLTNDDIDEINVVVDQFKADNKNYSVRGKWSLCFLAELGEYMRTNYAVFAPSLGNKGKLTLTCSVPSTQCLTVLAPYCISDASARLLGFLNKTYSEYIASVS